jgi:hypothetical protein
MVNAGIQVEAELEPELEPYRVDRARHLICSNRFELNSSTAQRPRISRESEILYALLFVQIPD